MRRFGTFALWLGLVLAAIGLVGGFGMMFMGESAWAKPLIGLVPVGFLLIFTGLVTYLLHPESSDEAARPPD